MDRDVINSLPYLIVEELKPNSPVSGVFGIADNVPMATSRETHIKRVHAIRFSYRGCYLAKNLGKNPHYTVTKDEFEEKIRQRCAYLEIPLKVYSSERVMQVSDILTVFNFPENTDTSYECVSPQGGSNTKKLRALLDELRFSDLSEGNEDRDRKEAITDKIRGPVQSHFGYGSNYSLTRQKEEDGGYVCPRVLGGEVPTDWKDRFRIMTEIADHLYNQEGGESIRGNADFELYGDEDRNAQFSRKNIHPGSKLEALTLSQTTFPHGALKIHMDLNNDNTDDGVNHNYNYVVCAWQYRLNNAGEAVRDAILGYSRRSIPDYLRRSASCVHYVNTVLRPWRDALPEWRKSIRPTADIFHASYFGGKAKLNDTGALLFPPTINKQATYLSAFSDAFLQFKTAYELDNNKAMTVERQLECILPVALCNSARPYTRVLRQWRQNSGLLEKCRNNNMTALFVEYSNDNFISFRNGGHPRHQPSFNEDPSYPWILFALRQLRQVVIKSVRPKYTFKCMTADLKVINRIGDLASQHLVHVLCLVGLIHPRFGMEAVICLGTRTARKISAKYGIPKSSFPCLVEHVARDLKYTPAQGENLTCKHIQPEDTTFKDCIEHDQQDVSWVDEHKGEPVLHRVSRNNELSAPCDLIRMRRIPFCKTLLFEGVTTMALLPADVESALQVWYGMFPSETLKNWSQAEIHSRKKRKKTAQVGTRPSKRRKIDRDTFSVYVPPPAPIIDWMKLDERELKLHTSQYNKDVQARAYAKMRDSAFGQDRAGGSDLRLCHSMGKHSLPSNRVREGRKIQDWLTHKTLFKNPTQLQSMGVQVVRFDLFHTAEDCFIRDYRDSLTNSRKDKLQCVVAVHASRINGGPGLCLYSAEARLMTMGKERTVLDRVYMGTSARPLSIAKNNVMVDCNCGENKDIPHDALLYRTKASAKEDLLWHLATRNNHADRWTSEKFPKTLWNIISKEEEANAFQTDTRNNRFLLLTLQNGPSNTARGDIFCCFMYGGNCGSTLSSVNPGCILASFHHGTKHHRVFTLSSQGVVLEDRTVQVNGSGPCKSATQSVNTPEQGKAVFTDSVHLPLSKQSQNHKSKDGIIRLPLEVDVFLSIKHSMRYQAIPLQSLIERWRPFWTERLDAWRSLFVPRGGGARTGDTYWFPPGTEKHNKYIRSGEDLRAYLDYCCEFSRHKNVEASTPSHHDLLLGWHRAQKEKKEQEKKTNKKGRKKNCRNK